MYNILEVGRNHRLHSKRLCNLAPGLLDFTHREPRSFGLSSGRARTQATGRRRRSRGSYSMMRRTYAAGAAAIALVVGLTGLERPAHAQNLALEEIVVT